MSSPLQFIYEDTPALWRAFYDPEGPQGLGKTKDEALFDLWLSCDFDADEETLMKAIVAALDASCENKSGGDDLEPWGYLYFYHDALGTTVVSADYPFGRTILGSQPLYTRRGEHPLFSKTPPKPGGKIIPGHRFCHNEMPGATMCQVCGADLPPSAGGNDG